MGTDAQIKSTTPTGVEAFSLSGRRALVTGGNRGLGRAFSFALAAAGASVISVARDHERNVALERAAADAGLDVAAIEGDITDDADIERSTARAITSLGGLDLLVNNAGVCYHAPSFEVTDEQWDDVFDLNVRALWKCSVAAARHMKANGGGAIVNVGSMSGLVVNRPQMQPAYNASKAAVHHLTKSLAAEWAPFGIRVNAIAPGYVATDMSPVDRPEFRRYWIEDAPLQRVATPEEIAPSVVFLASGAASFITGAVLVADGGYSLW